MVWRKLNLSIQLIILEYAQYSTSHTEIERQEEAHNVFSIGPRKVRDKNAPEEPEIFDPDSDVGLEGRLQSNTGMLIIIRFTGT